MISYVVGLKRDGKTTSEIIRLVYMRFGRRVSAEEVRAA
jgi:hypothetical protein